MCDFRGEPHSIQNVETGEILTIDQCKRANGTDYDNPELYGPKLSEITETGLYHVCATGAYYTFFDGDKWWGDFSWYEDHEYWQDKMDQIPVSDRKYRFLR